MTAPKPDLLCPACGYDLRGATEDRCSECGLVIDRKSLERSAIPWAHRREIGRCRAFVRTFWQVLWDAKGLRNEAAKPQVASDGFAFRRWIAGLVVLACLGLGGLFHLKAGVKELVFTDRDMRTLMAPGPVIDVMVPWSAGIALRPASLLYVVLFGIYIVQAPGAVFRTRAMLPQQAEASRAMGAYVSAPLAVLLVAVAAFAFLVSREEGISRHDQLDPKIFLGVMLILLASSVLAVGATIHRTGQWRARVLRGGYLTGFLAMGELVLRWIIGGGLILCIVPWCVGFLWILIDSFLK
jgi:hypothetical protein